MVGLGSISRRSSSKRALGTGMDVPRNWIRADVGAQEPDFKAVSGRRRRWVGAATKWLRNEVKLLPHNGEMRARERAPQRRSDARVRAPRGTNPRMNRSMSIFTQPARPNP